jgi:L,D-peptidoglycan transpeptidase YkuD (ErfK/YbiS/YcfS/YnhG family)
LRTVSRLLFAVTLAVAASIVGFVLATPGASAATTPGQVLTVQSTSAGATRARIDLWQRNAAGVYLHVWGSATGFVGELGVGTAREGIARTPAGVFGLTQAFGNGTNPGTKLPWFEAGPSDWWQGESGTPAYNTHVRQAQSPGSQSENLYNAGYVYSRAVVIDYNRFPAVAGRGSAFFLHVTNGQPTAGCVALSAGQLDQIMRRLDPAQHPVISIGVGSQATSIITRNNAAIAKRNPFGHLDAVTPRGSGQVAVAGWAADPDSMSAALRVHVYADGAGIKAISTGVARPDVAKARKTGPNQGFATTVGLRPGRHSVCVYVINIGQGTGHSLLGCRTITAT